MTGTYAGSSLNEICSAKSINSPQCFFKINDNLSYHFKDFQYNFYELKQQVLLLKHDISLQLKAHCNAINLKNIFFEETANKIRQNTAKLINDNSAKLNELIKKKMMINDCFEEEKLLKTQELAEVQNENLRLQEKMLEITKKSTVSYFATKNTAENNLQNSRKELSFLIRKTEKAHDSAEIQEKTKFKEIQSSLYNDAETIKKILAEIQKIHSEQLLTRSKFLENSASLQTSLKTCESKIEKLKKIFSKTCSKKIFFLETTKKLSSEIFFIRTKLLKLEKKK